MRRLLIHERCKCGLIAWNTKVHSVAPWVRTEAAPRPVADDNPGCHRRCGRRAAGRTVHHRFHQCVSVQIPCRAVVHDLSDMGVVSSVLHLYLERHAAHRAWRVRKRAGLADRIDAPCARSTCGAAGACVRITGMCVCVASSLPALRVERFCSHIFRNFENTRVEGLEARH